MKAIKLATISLLIVLTAILVPNVLASKDDNGTVILSKDNTLVLNTEVNGESTSEIIANAKELDRKLSKHEFRSKKHLLLFLNTPGGSIQSGLEMIEALQGIGRQVDTVTLFAASMGFQIAQNLGDRLILKNGVLMSHRAAGEIEGYFGGTHPSQLDSRYQLWLDRVRELDEQTVARTNGKQDYDSYTKQYANEMWLTGTKSVAQGYADRVVLVKCDESLAGATQQSTDFLGFHISYELDNCPINTSPMKVKISAPDGKVVSNELVNEIKTKFLDKFYNKQKQVLPMMF